MMTIAVMVSGSDAKARILSGWVDLTLYRVAGPMTIAAASASVAIADAGGHTMPIIEEEPPKKKKPHEIGEDLATLSLDELDERIALLKGEISRIEDAIRAKRASAAAADSFFKR